MKRFLLLVLFAALCLIDTQAQSTMTDSQVLQFVMKEHEAGTSQSQIITKLMQRGVDIQQIRRVKKTYERVAKKPTTECGITTGKPKPRLQPVTK